MAIGKLIKEQREKLGIGQSDLAKRIGISKQSLYKYETGIVTNVPSDVVEAIAKVLCCSPGYLMGWESIEEDMPKWAKNPEKLGKAHNVTGDYDTTRARDPEEIGLLKKWRALDERGKGNVKAILDNEYSQTPQGKAECQNPESA